MKTMLKAARVVAAISMAAVALGGVAASAQAEDTAVHMHSIASSDGVRIAYDVRGKGDVALVFVHCWACNRRFWKFQADAFASRYRVVTVDLAGHGESGKDRKTWSVLGLSNDVVSVANDLHLKKIILIGHSMGGPVCLHAAHELRGRVLGVILVDTMQDVSQRRTPAEAESDAEKLKKDFKGYFRDLSAIFAKDSDPVIRHWVEEQAVAADPSATIALKLDTPNLNPSELFKEAGVRIRAINAMPPLSDRTNLAEDRKFADYDAILVPDAGHFLQLERPNEFNADLNKWLLELTRPTR